MSDLKDYRTAEEISREDELIEMIALKSGIDKSRLEVGPSYLDPNEWHVDRRLRLDKRKIKARWWRPNSLTNEDAIDEFVKDLLEEVAWREESVL